MRTRLFSRGCPPGFQVRHRIELPDERLARLREVAARFGVSVEDLVRASIEGLLREPDENFQKALEAVLSKNAELYQRLA